MSLHYEAQCDTCSTKADFFLCSVSRGEAILSLRRHGWSHNRKTWQIDPRIEAENWVTCPACIGLDPEEQ